MSECTFCFDFEGTRRYPFDEAAAAICRHCFDQLQRLDLIPDYQNFESLPEEEEYQEMIGLRKDTEEGDS